MDKEVEVSYPGIRKVLIGPKLWSLKQGMEMRLCCFKVSIRSLQASIDLKISGEMRRQSEQF